MKGKDPGGMNAFSDAITSFGRHGVDGEGGEAALIIKVSSSYDYNITSFSTCFSSRILWIQVFR